MRKLLSLFALLFVVLGAHAQSWTVVDKTKYNHETIVYANLSFNLADHYLPDFKAAAFVLGECRAEGVATMNPQDQSDWFFIFNVRGDLTADAGRNIEFKVYDTKTGAEYEVDSDPIVMFDGESHISPSNRIQLTLTAATSVTINYFELGPGETVNLLDYVEVQPIGASLATNRVWTLGNFPEYGTIVGDQFTAASDVTGGALLALNIGSEWYYGSFAIVNHATALTANVTEVRVKVGAWIELTQDNKLLIYENGNERFIENFFSLTPADATDQVYFNRAADETILGDAQGSMSALKAGTTTATLCTRDAQWAVALESAPITFIVEQPVTEIQISSQTLTTSTAMHSTAPRIAQNITVWPEDATDKTYTVTSSDPSVLQITYFDTGDFTAQGLKAGNVTLTVKANDGSGVSNSFTVYVEDPAHTAWFDNNPLVVTLNAIDEPTDISQQILRNIHTDGNLQIDGSITAVAGGPVSGSGSITANGQFGSFTAQSEGTSTINVTLFYNDWDAYSGTGDVPRRSETFTFQVQVVVDIPLQDFTLVYTHNTNGKGGVLTATPVPANATFNASDIEIQVYNPNLANCYTTDWQNATLTLTSSANNVLTYDVQTPAPGTYIVNMPGYLEAGFWFDVPDALTLTAGWQWRSNPLGYITGDNMETIFQGDNFYEARTQDDLVINDPDWGYFGTLINAGLPPASCFKIKMTTAPASPSLIYDELADWQSVTLVPGWTWVGSPYFYNRSLANIFDTSVSSSFPEGLVIISKDGGSAEWNGQAWEGDLTVLKNHEGYLIENPSEGEITLEFASEFYSFPPVNDDENHGVKAEKHGVKAENHAQSIWQYDASRFMNNMTMVAVLPEIENLENYSIGAFVGDECRGEGHILNGKAFITIHTDGAEKVSLRLYNEVLGEYFDIDETFPTQMRLGSLKAPVQLHSTAVVTSIANVGADADTTQSYDLSGRRINSQQRGIRIQRMADGSVRKVLVK